MCLVFSIHCNRDETEDINEIVLNPKDESVDVEFTKEKSVPFTGINYGRLFFYNEGSNGNFYIYAYGYDSETEKKEIVKKYDSDLNVISQKEFPFGQGPGDVGTGTTFCQVGDYIYGPDNTTRKVNIFDKNFNFIRFVKMTDPFISTNFTKDGNYFFGFDTNWDPPKGYTYYLVRSTFPGLKKQRIHRIGTFWLWNKQKRVIVGIQPENCFFIKNEKLYYLNSADYRIIMFDMKGNKLKQVRMDVEKQKVPKEKRKEWLLEQTSVRGVQRWELTDIIQPVSWAIPLEKGFAVVKRKDYTTGCRGLAAADYFDYELNLLGKTEVPCFYQIFILRSLRFPGSVKYHEGYLYLIYEDEEKEEFYLEKWKVEEKL